MQIINEKLLLKLPTKRKKKIILKSLEQIYDKKVPKDILNELDNATEEDINRTFLNLYCYMKSNVTN